MNVRCGICHQTYGCECEQQPLFALDEPRRCTACGTTDPTRCGHDKKRDEGLVSSTRKRPRSCLNAWDPATAPFPEGY